MATKRDAAEEKAELAKKKGSPQGHAMEASVGTLGAISGAGLGAVAAGPPGAIVGGIIGAAMGAATGWAADEQAAEELEADAELDADIGVTEGTIGAPNLQHPPPVIGAPSAEAAGAAAARNVSPTDAAGPMEPPRD
ncbi:MAG: hypothetical protein ACOY0T_33720 [Myxococcota bacterium]